MRNLDISSLRSVLAIVDYGGVSHAAARLNLTQSAVSMQIKRLEEMLGTPIFRREARKMIPTTQGELLISYARKMVAMNDEVWGRLTAKTYEGTIRIGVPVDIVEPYVATVLAQFARKFPRVELQLRNSRTFDLLSDFAAGKLDLILTTEREGKGFEIVRKPLRWTHAIGGHAFEQRPIPLAMNGNCSFREFGIAELDKAGIEWQTHTEETSWATVKAIVAADLAIHIEIEEPITLVGRQYYEGDVLPQLPDVGIYLYKGAHESPELLEELAAIVADTYRWETPRAEAIAPALT